MLQSGLNLFASRKENSKTKCVLDILQDEKNLKVLLNNFFIDLHFWLLVPNAVYLSKMSFLEIDKSYFKVVIFIGKSIFYYNFIWIFF